MTDDWHGWSLGAPKSPALHIGYLPGRKSCCLYSLKYPEDGGVVLDVHAYFRSEEHAREALRVLDLLVDGPR